MDAAGSAPVTEDAPSQRVDSVVRRLTTLGLGVAVMMLALGIVMLSSARDDVRREAQQSSANLTLALERDIARNIMSLDLSIQGAMDAMALPGMELVSPDIRQTALFDRAATAEYLGSILVLDRTGQVIVASTGGDISKLKLDDRDYFQIHRDRQAAGLYISQPYLSRLRAGDASIAVSRRVSGANGAFEGVVMGALRIAYFRHLFETLDLGPGGTVALIRTDGTLVARQPPVEGDAGRNVSQSSAFRRMQGLRAGSFVERSAIDGVERLYAFRQIGELPLVLSVGLSLSDIYASWWRKTIVIGAILLALSVATAVLCLLFRREMIRRIAAQEALVEAAKRLHIVASTDSLTGLANRRAFEAALDQEWRRASRLGIEISLLMMDADFFKPYNDLYGHPAGDAALMRLAGAIQANIRRPSDFAARIGGEEFVALLPTTGVDGAAVLADKIRQAVHDLAIAHAGSPFGRMTVCIGVASVRPDAGGAPGALMKLADDAMYRAKEAGRDRVMVSDGAGAAVGEPLATLTDGGATGG